MCRRTLSAPRDLLAIIVMVAGFVAPAMCAEIIVENVPYVAQKGHLD